MLSAKFNYEQGIRNAQRLSIMDQYEKSNEDYKQQLKNNKAAARAAVQSQNKVYAGRAGEIREQVQDLKIQQKREAIATDYQLGQVGFTLDQAVFKAKQDIKATKLDFKNQRLAINAERSEITRQDQLNTVRSNRIDLTEDRRLDAVTGLGIEDRGLNLEQRNAIADRNFEMLSC